jgi:hypothetical protein
MSKFEIPKDPKLMIDLLGDISAQRANLKIQEKKLKHIIATRLGSGAHEGHTFRVTVSFSERATLSLEAAIEKLKFLGVSKQWFTAHTKHTPVTTVTPRARTGHNLLAA